MATRDVAGEAESLVRSLAGVSHATIRASEAGIESVHVTASDDQAALHMAAHVRSALLAGLATPVVPARIHVDVAEPPARDRIRLIHDHQDNGAGNRHQPADDDHGPALTSTLQVTPHPPSTLIGRPRLVAVDADRPGDGRVVCRVSAAYHTCVHRAEAVAVDLPGAAAQAAAQATVYALIDAGLTGLELNGLREVEIAGRNYVLVALRRTHPFARTRSGSAPIVGSAERSAAEATVAAAASFE